MIAGMCVKQLWRWMVLASSGTDTVWKGHGEKGTSLWALRCPLSWECIHMLSIQNKI